MATLYEYVCPPCLDIGLVLEEELEPGRVTIFRPMADRDLEVLCPNCEKAMIRSTYPDAFTVWWRSNASEKSKHYSILEGPTVVRSIRADEAKRKKARNESRRHFNIITPEAHRELKADAKRAPTAREVPSPGISVQKVP